MGHRGTKHELWMAGWWKLCCTTAGQCSSTSGLPERHDRSRWLITPDPVWHVEDAAPLQTQQQGHHTLHIFTASHSYYIEHTKSIGLFRGALLAGGSGMRFEHFIGMS